MMFLKFSQSLFMGLAALGICGYFTSWAQGSATAQTPEPLEIVDITSTARFTVDAPRTGDTLSYIITVEWSDPKVPVTVLAPDSLTFEGLVKTGASTNQKKTASVEQGAPAIKSKLEFVYNLRAVSPGTGKASSARLEYFSALSSEREYLSVSPALITIGKAKVPFHRSLIFKILLGLVAAGLLGLGFVYLKKYRASKKSAGAKKPSGIAEEMTLLKGRLDTADSRGLLLEMEKLSLRYLREQLSAPDGQKIEFLLPKYLETQNDSVKGNWEKVKAELEFAKFGGGRKAAHEMVEIYQTLCKCLHVTPEEKED